MKLLKTVFNFTIPLAVMLIIFSMYLTVNKVVNNYKQSIAGDYTIIVTADKPLQKLERVAGIKVKELQMLDQKIIIEDIKDTLSSSTLELLNHNLPFFYKVYLDEFPSKSKLSQIKKELLNKPDISTVEMFTEDHNHIYSFLILIQNISFILFFVVLAFSILLVVRQIKIWFFEHNRRIRIMELHGGSLLYSSKPILTVIGISSVLSFLLTVGIMFFSIMNISMFVQKEIIQFMPKAGDMGIEMLLVALLSVAIPIVTYLGLLIKYKLK